MEYSVWCLEDNLKSDLSIDRRKDDLPLRRRKAIYALEGQELCLWKKRRSIHLSSNGKNLTQLLQHSHHWEEEISIPFGLLQSFPVVKYKLIKTILSFPVGNEHAVFLLATQVGNRKVIHLSFDWILDFFFLKKTLFVPLLWLLLTVPFWKAHSGSPETMQVDRSFSFHSSMVTSLSTTPLSCSPLNIPLPQSLQLSSCGDSKEIAQTRQETKLCNILTNGSNKKLFISIWTTTDRRA